MYWSCLASNTIAYLANGDSEMRIIHTTPWSEMYVVNSYLLVWGSVLRDVGMIQRQKEVGHQEP
jgi:hypothetical protein